MDEPDGVEQGPIWPPDEIIGQPLGMPGTDQAPRHAGQPVPVRRSPWSQPPRAAPQTAAPQTAAPQTAVPLTAVPLTAVPVPAMAVSIPRPATVPESLDGDRVRVRHFTGLRQVSVANPERGAGKTVATLLLAMIAGHRRAGSVLAWDRGLASEVRAEPVRGGADDDRSVADPLASDGSLPQRAEASFHDRDETDLLRAPQGLTRAELHRYVREQAGGTYDVLAGGRQPGPDEFGQVRDLLAQFYSLVIVDTGTDAELELDATDQLVVTMSARDGSAQAAAQMLDQLEQSGRRQMVRHAVAIVTMPSSRRNVDIRAVTRHFSARTRAVLIAPFDRAIAAGGPIRYDALSIATREAWTRIAATVTEGL